jgi:hypothetical protein
MHDDHEQLDDELARLAQSLRRGEHMLACLQLAEFALKLDHYIRREERALGCAYRLLEESSPKAMATVRREHLSLRQLVASIANALDRADDRRGVEIVGKLRSVLLLHVTKEELLLAPPTSYAVH